MDIMKYTQNRAVITGSLYWQKIKQELEQYNVQHMAWDEYRQIVNNNSEIQRLYGEYCTYCDILNKLGENELELREYAQEAIKYIYNKVVQK